MFPPREIIQNWKWLIRYQSFLISTHISLWGNSYLNGINQLLFWGTLLNCFLFLKPRDFPTLRWTTLITIIPKFHPHWVTERQHSDMDLKPQCLKYSKLIMAKPLRKFHFMKWMTWHFVEISQKALKKVKPLGNLGAVLKMFELLIGLQFTYLSKSRLTLVISISYHRIRVHRQEKTQSMQDCACFQKIEHTTKDNNQDLKII